MNLKQQIKESYNKNATTWTEKYSLRNYVHAYIEKPAILKLLGDIRNKKILCAGCGDGEEAHMFYQQGAYVVGFDISDELINIAKSKYPNILFYVGDSESFSTNETFDIVYAGFVVHYLPSYTKFLSNTCSLLKNGGEVVFSVVHPIKRSFDVFKSNGRKYKILGTSKLEDGSKQETYGDYLNPREVNIKFGENFETTNYHRTIGEQIKDILDSDFELLSLIEPKPIEKAREDYPEKYVADCKIPEVLIYHLRKKSG